MKTLEGITSFIWLISPELILSTAKVLHSEIVPMANNAPKNEGLGLRKLGGNIARTGLRQVLSLFFSIGGAILLARLLGAEGKGQLAVAMLLPFGLTVVMNLGVAPANVYHVSRGTVSLRTAFQTTTMLWVIFAALGGIAAAATLAVTGDRFFPGVSMGILWLSLLLFPIGLGFRFGQSLLQAAQDFSAYNWAAITPTVLILPLLAIGVGWIKWGVTGALVASVVAESCALILTLAWIRRHLIQNSSDMATDAPIGYWKICLGYGWKAHIGNIAGSLNYKIDLFLVNFLLDPESAGVYSVAVAIAERVWMFSAPVSLVLSPRLAELHKDEAKRRRITPLVARWVFIFSFWGAVFGGLLAKWMVPVLFGVEFSYASNLVVILLPGVVIFGMAKPLAADIAARGRPELNLYSAAAVVSLNVGLNLFLIPRMGTAGAAWATTAAYTLVAVLILFLYARVSRNPWWSPLWFSSDDKMVLKRLLSLVNNGIKTIFRSVA